MCKRLQQHGLSNISGSKLIQVIISKMQMGGAVAENSKTLYTPIGQEGSTLILIQVLQILHFVA